LGTKEGKERGGTDEGAEKKSHIAIKKKKKKDKLPNAKRGNPPTEWVFGLERGTKRSGEKSWKFLPEKKSPKKVKKLKPSEWKLTGDPVHQNGERKHPVFRVKPCVWCFCQKNRQTVLENQKSKKK